VTNGSLRSWDPHFAWFWMQTRFESSIDLGRGVVSYRIVYRIRRARREGIPWRGTNWKWKVLRTDVIGSGFVPKIAEHF
jgi:hypothetical protein